MPWLPPLAGWGSAHPVGRGWPRRRKARCRAGWGSKVWGENLRQVKRSDLWSLSGELLLWARPCRGGQVLHWTLHAACQRSDRGKQGRGQRMPGNSCSHCWPLGWHCLLTLPQVWDKVLKGQSRSPCGGQKEQALQRQNDRVPHAGCVTLGKSLGFSESASGCVTWR